MEIICKKVSKIISNSDNQNYASNNNNFLVIILLAMMIHIMKDTQIQQKKLYRQLKNLQNNIIKKDSDIKQKKFIFEIQKISLYQKAKKAQNKKIIYIIKI